MQDRISNAGKVAGPDRQGLGLHGKVVAVVAGLALLAGCSERQPEEARFMSAPEATVGDALSGELTTASSINLNDGARYSPHWICPGEATDGVTSYVLDAAFPGVLTAFDKSGSLRGVAEGESPSLLVGADHEACTLVVVNGGDATSFGPYRLVAQAHASAEQLILDTPLTGSLGEDGKASHVITLEQAGRLDLALSSGGALALSLHGEGREERVQVCADEEQRLEAYLEPGDYRVEVAAAATDNALTATSGCGGDTLVLGNAYRLLASADDLSTGMRNEGPLRGGDSITGVLESGARNRYRLDIDEPSEISIELSSAQFDALLSLDGEGQSLSNDDGGGGINGTDALLETVLLPGRYEVQVSGYGAAGGDYTLEMQRSAFEGELRNDGEILLEESLVGILDGSGPNSYRLTLEEAAGVRVMLGSSSFDAVLRLHGNGIDISDDDSGGNLDALLSAVLEPGSYTLEAQSYSGAGAYRLEVAGEAIEGELRNGGEVRVGDAVVGSLSPGGVLDYELVLEEDATIVLEATSPTVDTILSLSGNGVEIENDDADGLGLGSRLTQFLEAGRYGLGVRAWDVGGGSGTIRLEVRR
ncbi:hypothetical protein IOC61_13790 [Halomonas sp. KAO]|uniref:hypothetical protein n=1 Tax=unclassified Halomonas TaxID=2609666 RepID=UPI00189E8B8E|nr:MULTISPECIES: hypothetical protein [unclassified Halomonas]MBF7054373.1 hypothetical protein [Halomonas sp. KAO]MDT0499878.1 hypothetical protein [Halomonas sp. PAR7]MDT0512283.1 hypothetical protein [Halomonas sp. LES1]MDT0590916.1 hypothetical protein [Halomonas sp. PAR8]